MSTFTYDTAISLRTMTCCNGDCGIAFAVPVEWNDKKRRDHSTFYCPNGHAQGYKAQSDVERAEAAAKRAQELLAYERQESERYRQRIRQTERQLSAQRGVTTRLKNRAKNGVCPCCNRSFENLKRHMASKHPDFAVEQSK